LKWAAKDTGTQDPERKEDWKKLVRVRDVKFEARRLTESELEKILSKRRLLVFE
jgi:hypothetical protein